MFQRHLLIFLFCLGACLSTRGQGDPLPGIGARVAGMGNAFVAVKGNVWSLFHNPAAITGGTGLDVGAYFEQRFFLPELTFGNAGALYSLNENQAIGLSLGSNGFSGYRENTAGLSYGITVLDKISIGATANLATVSVPTYGTATTFFINFGAHFEISEQLSVGTSIYNTNRSNFETALGSREFFPTVITAGLAYYPTDQVLLVFDVQKDIDHPVSFKGGIEYALNEVLYARLGVSTAPLLLSGGIGLNYKTFKFDFAISYTEFLQYTPHVSVNYAFGQ
ncbi:MAG: hypothetical protein AAFQ92_25655 [Bacteroidota bacterium]